MRKKLLIGSVLLLTGCSGVANSITPTIDMKEVDTTKYTEDLQECRAYANQKDPAAQAFTGALLGAALGYGLGATMGANPGDVMWTGAIAGGVGGAGAGVYDAHQVVANCMSGRGYKVLGL